MNGIRLQSAGFDLPMRFDWLGLNACHVLDEAFE